MVTLMELKRDSFGNEILFEHESHELNEYFILLTNFFLLNAHGFLLNAHGFLFFFTHTDLTDLTDFCLRQFLIMGFLDF